tara:strand:+ start:1095 stop:1844 length:750 start_codon:yes stop_codon:yes gene_type:complete
MGFLNHATNNIIVDAVLTEKGRELLARNDGSFNITGFSFADDEVDYEVLKHYGLIIGKEKIEKNTPVFEAITDQDLAIKYENISLTNNTTEIFAFPKILLEDSALTYTLSSNSESTNNKSLVVNVKTFLSQDSDFELTEPGLIDDTFFIKVFDELLEITGEDIEPPDNRNNVAVYEVNSVLEGRNTTREFVGQRFLSFTISAINKVSTSTFQFYASSSNPNEIKTQIEIEGASSGATFIIPVTITSNTL